MRKSCEKAGKIMPERIWYVISANELCNHH
jgi:hypothetical protein